eukprot:395281-Amphidinium_carterae.1
MHKQLLTASGVPLKHRCDATKTVTHPTLFWGVTVSVLHKTTLQKIDSQALALAKLTAGMRRHDEDVDTFNNDTAKLLRTSLGENELKWSNKLIRLQGQLIGHCLRQPDHYPECACVSAVAFTGMGWIQ